MVKQGKTKFLFINKYQLKSQSMSILYNLGAIRKNDDFIQRWLPLLAHPPYFKGLRHRMTASKNVLKFNVFITYEI